MRARDTHLAYLLHSLSLMTRIAIPVFDDQMATVLDYSSRFVLVVLDGEKVQGRLEMTLSPESPEMFLWLLEGFQVDVLLCGAVSSSLLELLTRRGIDVINCVRGPVDQVIKAYAQGKLASRRFRLPGASAPTLPSRGRRPGSGRIRKASSHPEASKEVE